MSISVLRNGEFQQLSEEEQLVTRIIYTQTRTYDGYIVGEYVEDVRRYLTEYEKLTGHELSNFCNHCRRLIHSAEQHVSSGQRVIDRAKKDLFGVTH